jgi:hypothetical protein
MPWRVSYCAHRQSSPCRVLVLMLSAGHLPLPAATTAATPAATDPLVLAHEAWDVVERIREMARGTSMAARNMLDQFVEVVRSELLPLMPRNQVRDVVRWALGGGGTAEIGSHI